MTDLYTVVGLSVAAAMLFVVTIVRWIVESRARQAHNAAAAMAAREPTVPHGYSYAETFERREAFKRGLSLEEYRKVDREETARYAAESLGITPEEAVTQGLHELSDIMIRYEVLARKRSAALGRTVTRKEVREEEIQWISAAHEKYLEKLSDPLERAREEEEVQCMTYGPLSTRRLAEYVETGTFTGDQSWEQLAHLQACQRCQADVARGRAEYASVPGPECFTTDELALVVETGDLPKERKAHENTCHRCKLHFERSEGKHHANPPGLECLNREELHLLHSEGIIPLQRREHTTKCERCRRELNRHIEIHLDKILPMPRLRVPGK